MPPPTFRRPIVIHGINWFLPRARLGQELRINGHFCYWTDLVVFSHQYSDSDDDYTFTLGTKIRLLSTTFINKALFYQGKLTIDNTLLSFETFMKTI